MKKSFLFAAAALVAVSCSKREMGYDPYEADPNEVRFSSGSVGVTPDSKVTVDGASKFELDDEIGIYAVYDGKKIDEADAFPTNTSVQYKNKFFKVTDVAVDDPYTATFDATSDDNRIYYLPGGQAYNYYAYFPTSTASAKPINSSFKIEETTNQFANQTGLFRQEVAGGAATKIASYPGPMMYAYYSTPDKAPVSGSPVTPVELSFKYANAKLSLSIVMDKNAGTVEEITGVELYATSGMYQGYTFDLTQADEPVPAVVKQGNTDLMDGSGTALSAASYHFQNLIKTAGGGATSESYVTGYLIPADAIEDARIRITKGSGLQAEVFTARLDKSATGEDVGGTNYLPSIEAGKEYKFKITITKTEVKFTGTIEDWDVVDNSGTEIPAE